MLNDCFPSLLMATLFVVPSASAQTRSQQTFPEVANLADADFQMKKIHEHNIEALWSVAP